MSKEENDNIVQALEHSGLCREFTQDEILSLIKEKDTDIKKYKKGSFIFEEDDTPDKLYVLKIPEICLRKFICLWERANMICRHRR